MLILGSFDDVDLSLQILAFVAAGGLIIVFAAMAWSYFAKRRHRGKIWVVF